MVSRKKVAVLLDFVQMRGGGACPNFCVHFSHIVILSQFGDGDVLIFWHIGVQKRWYELSKLGGGGGGSR